MHRRSTRAKAGSCWRIPRSEAAGLIREQPDAARWLARLDFVKQALPELGWTEFDDDELIRVVATVCHGRTNREEVEHADFVPFLQSRLAPD